MREGALGSFFRRIMLRIKRFFFLKRKENKIREINKNIYNKKELKNKTKKKEEEYSYYLKTKKEKGKKREIHLTNDKLNSVVNKTSKLALKATKKHKNKAVFSKKSENIQTIKNQKYPLKQTINKTVEKANQVGLENVANNKALENKLIKEKEFLFNEEICKLINKFKDNVTNTKTKLDLLYKECDLKNNNQKVLKELKIIEKQIEEYYQFYFNIKEGNFSKIKELQKFYAYIKGINKFEYKYFNDLYMYNALLLLDIKKQEIEKTISNKYEESSKIEISKNLENSHLMYNNKNTIELNSLENKTQFEQSFKEEVMIGEKKSNMIDDKNETLIIEQKELIKAEKKNDEIINKKIKIPDYSNSIIKNIIENIKRHLFIVNAIPIMIISKKIPTIILSIYMINKEIQKIKNKVNNKKQIKKIKEEKIEEQMLKNINLYETLGYFVNKSILELEELDAELCKKYEEDNNLKKYINEIRNIKLNLIEQKKKIKLSKLILNKEKKKILTIVNK